jgi:Flp pilus assembly protein TadG
MLNRLKYMRSDRRGSAVIEFAMFAPIFLIVLVGVIEYGRVLAQTNAVEKGMRAGAMLAARSDYPLTDAQYERIQNVVMTGNVDGTLPYLTEGWEDAGSSVEIESSTFTSGGVTNWPVFRIEATVPYQALLPGLMSTFGLADLEISTAHEQALVGN